MQSHVSSLAGESLMLGSPHVGKGELRDPAPCPAPLQELWHSEEITPKTRESRQLCWPWAPAWDLPLLPRVSR